MKMVFNQISEEQSTSNDQPEYSIKKKIFTCEELEGRKMKLNAFQKHLKHADSSIMLYSTSSDMTRYDIADLKKIKDSKLSQQPPCCFYDPNIMRLNILKYKNRDPVVVDIQMKAFREKLQNLSVTGWDPNILQLLRNYHNALLNPFYNGYTGNYQNQQQQMFNPQQPQAFNQPTQSQFQPCPDRVSLMEKQQAVLDKIPSYDRKMNFFDNITTTANIPPPRTMMNFDHRQQATFFKRPNNNYNNQQQQQHHQSNYLRKPNSCASEQHGNSYSSSVGYFSGNDTKSSCGEESVLEKPSEKRTCFESNKKIEPSKAEDEKEPEWFSVPATLEDFIDLHGFSDEDIAEQPEAEDKEKCLEVKQAAENQRNNMSTNSFNHEYQPNQNRRYSHNSSYNRYSHNSGYSSHNSSYNQSFNSQNSSYSNNSYYNARNMNYRNNTVNNNANQRFRNPLHFNKPAPRTSSAAAPPQIMNPFFDAWKSGKFLHQQNVSFSDLMEQNYPKNLPSNAMHISEVENRMKQQQSYNPMHHQAPPQTAVPQFFQNLANNWGVRVNENPSHAYQYQNNVGPPQMPPQAMYDGHKIPTQEQLQQFTSEIMRNAIIRKNQQYHDENNYQK
ncbi:unnamed protein product [Chironomus riparius]|uniref:Uncharacterized protein n=1 Tax=Chironomus riparius TaxID=315576 RepID=A0A9N9WXB1_9DIPT|nr:unnamed protein product [Chironomus riparius]